MTEQSLIMNILPLWQKDKDHSQTYFCNGNSNGDYCMTTKMARVLLSVHK